MTQITPAVRILIIINAALFLLNSMTLYDFNKVLGLYIPDNSNFVVWQYVTSMFMHGGVVHILFNMMGLWMFGSALEKIWGMKKFLTLYFVAGIGAGVISGFVNSYEHSNYVAAVDAVGMYGNEVTEFLASGRYIPYDGLTEDMISRLYHNFNSTTIGASGALYGVIVAFAMRFPNAKMAFIFIPFPVAAKYFAPALLCLDLVSVFTGFSIFGGGIAHYAHLGGALTGFLLMLYWRNLK